MTTPQALPFRPADPAHGLHDPAWWVWCGSPVRDPQGRHHLFASRWPRHLPFFTGYIVASEIVRAEAATPEGPYAVAEVVLPARGEGWWDGRMTHNPAVVAWGGRWYLYYIGATFPGPVPGAEALATRPPVVDQTYATIRIGVCVADHPAGPWRRCDRPVLVPRPGRWDGGVVTNPAPCVAPDGRILLYYRSNTPEGLRIGLAVAEHPEGPFVRASDRPVLDLPGGCHVEDPFVWWAGDRFRMIAKDMTGGLTGERHAGVALESDHGLAWRVGTPAMAYSRSVAWCDGRRQHLGSLERPALLFSADGRPTHLFGATADGPGGFDHAAHTWNAVFPLA